MLSLETSLAVQALQVSGTVVGFCQEPGSSAISILDSNGNISTWDWENNKTKVVKASPNGTLRSYAATHIDASDAKKQDVSRVILTTSQKGSNIYVGDKIAYKTKYALQDVHVFGTLEFVMATGPAVVVLGRRKANSADDFTWAELATSGQLTCAHSALRRDGQAGSPLACALHSVTPTVRSIFTKTCLACSVERSYPHHEFCTGIAMLSPLSSSRLITST